MCLSTNALLTHYGYHLRFLAILVLITGRNPASIATRVRGAANAGEHKPRGHCEGGENGADGPNPAVREERVDEARGERKEQKEGERGAPPSPVEGRFVGDGDRRRARELFGKGFGIKTAVVAYDKHRHQEYAQKLTGRSQIWKGQSCR
jgi:hypothetical protein